MFESEPEHSWGLHKMVVDNYPVCYVVDEYVVTVTDVLCGASDIHRRLQERYEASAVRFDALMYGIELVSFVCPGLLAYNLTYEFTGDICGKPYGIHTDPVLIYK